MDFSSQEIDALRAQLEQLGGLEQIRGRIYQYARALDRLDRELLEAQFWPDATVDYGEIYRGAIAGFLDVAMGFQGSMRDTQHFIGNILIEMDGDAASAESYVHAQHVLVEGDRLVQLVVGGRYLDRFARRENLWRLCHRTEVLDWGRRLPMTERWFDENAQLPKGRRGREDLSYSFL